MICINVLSYIMINLIAHMKAKKQINPKFKAFTQFICLEYNFLSDPIKNVKNPIFHIRDLNLHGLSEKFVDTLANRKSNASMWRSLA